MCVILHLKPGVMPTKDQLWNACYNNWHSYGLVIKLDSRLHIQKKCPESGEVDPQEVWNLLEQDVDEERFLHLRHNTAGATTLDNTHPFDVFYQDGKNHRQVVFMHNGTLYSYKSKKKGPTGGEIDDDTGPSDTKNFVDRVLVPAMSQLDCGRGKGDIQNPFFKEMIKKFWSTGNRGLLISSDQDAVFIDDWKTMKGDGGKEFLSSNDTYFDKVDRGPEHTRRLVRAENEKKARETGTAVVTTKGTKQFVRLADFDFGPTRHPFFTLSESTVNLLNDWDFYDRQNAVSLGYASIEELSDLYKEKNDCLVVMDWVFTDYAQLYKEYEDLEEKHKKASNKIAELVEEIKSLRPVLQKVS